MIVPKSFLMAGNRWRVKMRKKMDTYGLCDFESHTIYIAEKVGSRVVPQEDQVKTFIHEALHALEFTMGRQADEEFVSAAEQLIYQAMRTARGNHYEI